MGSSGGGISTLLRWLNGLTSFEAGEIRVGPHVLPPRRTHGNDPAIRQMRRLFGMVFQDFQLFPHLTALENVIEAPRRGARRPPAAGGGRGPAPAHGLRPRAPPPHRAA